jgi:hypothetical protein
MWVYTLTTSKTKQELCVKERKKLENKQHQPAAHNQVALKKLPSGFA